MARKAKKKARRSKSSRYYVGLTEELLDQIEEWKRGRSPEKMIWDRAEAIRCLIKLGLEYSKRMKG